MANLAEVKKPDQAVKEFLTQSLSSIRLTMPRHMDAERLIQIAVSEVRRNPKLMECDPVSICKAAMHCARIGLYPGGPLARVHLVPYGRECALQVDYKGLIELARRSGEISSIYAFVVYDGDDFEVVMGTTPSIMHIPRFKTSKPSHFYAVAKLKDGSAQFEVMTVQQVEAHRNQFSKAKNSDAWNRSFDEMAKKTVVRRLIKYLPISEELQDTLQYDIDHFANEKPIEEPKTYIDVVRAEDIPTDSDLRVAQDGFRQAFQKAQAAKVKVDDLVKPNYEGVMERADACTLFALTAAIERRVQPPT